MSHAWCMQADPTIWCVSSWNDNGFKDLVSESDASKLFRTDFFPGLGWMLRRRRSCSDPSPTDRHIDPSLCKRDFRELWLELSPSFPIEHWDHWMRLHSTNKGRDCIVPYVSRNYNIGKLHHVCADLPARQGRARLVCRHRGCQYAVIAVRAVPEAHPVQHTSGSGARGG